MFASVEQARRSRRRAPTLTAWLGIGLAALLSSSTVGAQQSGALQGWVYDERGQLPLQGVDVLLEKSGERTSTDREGRFYLEAVPAGRIDVRLTLDGYVSQVESVEITALEVTLIQFRLQPVAAVLDEILVRLGGSRRAPGHAEGEAPARAEGSLTAADLLIQRIPGLSARRTNGAVGDGLRVSLRGANSITLSDQPAVYLDGVRIDVGGTLDMRVLDQIPAADVQRIRVLRGPAAAARYPLSATGVILVETRRASPPPPGR
jgi:hypothetical protein